MQLKIQRTQRLAGVLGKTVVFCLDVRAEYQPAEAENIRKYKLGSEIIYSSQAARRHSENASAHLDRTQDGTTGNRMAGLAHGIYSMAMAKMNLNITIASLGQGQHIECKDLSELMEAEEAVMNACRNLRDYLAVAASFNGSIVLIDFSDGEKVHTGTLQLPSPGAAAVVAPHPAPLAIDSGALTPEDAVAEATPYDPPPAISFELLREYWASTRAAYARNPTLFYRCGLVGCAFAILAMWGFGVLTALSFIGLVTAAILWGKRRGAV